MTLEKQFLTPQPSDQNCRVNEILRQVYAKGVISKVQAVTTMDMLLKEDTENPQHVFMIVKFLIDEFNLSKEDILKNTTHVVANNYLDVFKYLHGAFGFTSEDIRSNYIKALRYSSRHGNIEMLRYLKKEFNLTTEDARVDQNYALRISAERGHIEIVKYLHTEFNLTAEDARAIKNYALRKSAERGHIEILKYLHTEFNLTTEDARAEHNWALMYCAINGHIEILKYLHTDFGLTIEYARDVPYLSAKNGHYEVLQYCKTGFGMTTEDVLSKHNLCFREAVCEGHVEVVKCLKEDFGLTEEDTLINGNNWALTYSFAKGRHDMVKYLQTAFGFEDTPEMVLQKTLAKLSSLY